jgi:hypothetical protein
LTGKINIDISSLPNAVYQVKISGVNGNIVKRLVKE